MLINESWDKDFIIPGDAWPDPDFNFKTIEDELRDHFRIGLRFLLSGGLQVLYSRDEYIAKSYLPDCSLYNYKTNALILQIVINFDQVEIMNSSGGILYTIPIIDEGLS